MKFIQYVGSFDEVEVFGLGAIKRGDSVECPDDLAGKPPRGDVGDKGYDAGEGLLAQPENWKPAKSATKKADDSNDSQEG